MREPTGPEVAIAGLAALAVAMGIGRFAFTPLLPMMQGDAGLTVAQGGWLASANYVGYLLGAMSATALRFPAATAIRGGLIVIGVATLAMGFEHRFSVWMGLRAVAGIANAWVGIFVFAWCLERLAPLDRPLLNGVVFAGVGAGILTVGVLCIALMHAAVGSEEAWIVLGVLSLVIAAAVWATFETNQTKGTNSAEGASSVAGHPVEGARGWDAESVRLVLCFAAAGYGYIIPSTFLPVMARQAIDNPAIFGWSWPVFGAAAMATTLAAAQFARSIGTRRLWMASQLIMATGVALPVVWPGLAAIMVAALLVGGTFMVITMTSMQEARVVGGRDPTRLIAAMTAAFALGQIVGPVSVSYTITAGGDFSVALLVASLILGVGAYGLSRSPREEAAARPIGSQLTERNMR
jgi:predicted MFS family arabinose efflux permease